MAQGLCALQPVEANISTRAKVVTGLLGRSFPLYASVSISFIAPSKCTRVKKIQKKLRPNKAGIHKIHLVWKKFQYGLSPSYPWGYSALFCGCVITASTRLLRQMWGRSLKDLLRSVKVQYRSETSHTIQLFSFTPEYVSRLMTTDL